MFRHIINFVLYEDDVILRTGLTILACHLALYTLLRSKLIPNGPWKVIPSATAHQIIAFVLMVYQSYLGFYYFSWSNWKILSDSTDSGGYYMAQFCMGSMLFWDIPVGMMSNGMGNNTIMHLHHIGFFCVAAISIGLFSPDGMPLGAASYAPFFFGCIELSSIPLQIVDLFHPKRSPDWYEYSKNSKFLCSLNDLCRTSFALSFLLVRGMMWPYVIGTGAIPDYWETSVKYPQYVIPCRIMVTMAFSFTILQSYWAILVLKQIIKIVMGKNNDEKKKE